MLYNKIKLLMKGKSDSWLKLARDPFIHLGKATAGSSVLEVLESKERDLFL